MVCWQFQDLHIPFCLPTTPLLPALSTTAPHLYSLCFALIAVLTSWPKGKEERNWTEQFVSQVATFSRGLLSVFFLGFGFCCGCVCARWCELLYVLKNANPTK